jgi:hypothetical protein
MNWVDAETLFGDLRRARRKESMAAGKGAAGHPEKE